MKKARFAALALFAACAYPSLAHAQASRTWVSGVGDDANPCSRTAPCKTFAGAISKTAEFGEIDTLDPGGFGAVTITKSITIDATSGLGGLLAAGTSGMVINAGSTDTVILRHLDINGFGTGIYGINILAAGDVRIEDSKIYGFTQRGIFDQRTGGRLFVADTVISNIAQTAIAAAPGGSALAVNLDNVRMHNNGNAGLAVGGGAQAMVNNSWASSNVEGFYADTGGVINLNNSTAFANSHAGIYSLSGAVFRIFGCTVTDNTYGLLTGGGGSIGSYGGNRIYGNAIDGTPGILPVK
jgi:parallel beta helix pectate lyase-like protein